jgi:thioredoxin reductase (NADPH)
MAEQYDVVIIGAGPAGLAAALYTSREDLRTLVLDKGVAGGLIATTEMVDNYPGFPNGIGGIELADHMKKQAQRFGAEVKTMTAVTALKPSDGGIEIDASTGPIRTRSVLIATGSSYRKLNVPGEKELEGRGVHYCATCDGPLYRGKHIIAVGGGNTALQEGLFLTKFARKLTLLVRGPELKGSEVLAIALKSKPNVEIKFNTSITEVRAEDGKFIGVATTSSGDVAQIDADGLFPFIGLLPNSDWLKGVKLDAKGFVVASREFATNLPGVFAAGDIIEGSVGQVASAVGEGVSAALSIRKYLDPHHIAASYATIEG